MAKIRLVKYFADTTVCLAQGMQDAKLLRMWDALTKAV